MVKFPTDKKFIALIDFEATCSNDNSVPREEMEIIEFACVVIDKNLKMHHKFSEFIKPVVHPKLTEFCIELTTITQDQVDKAIGFQPVLQKFEKEIVNKYNPLFASWGLYDRTQLQQDCRYHNYPYPFDDEHLDIKRWLPQFLGLNKPKGIEGMLKHLSLEFIGTPHRGIDDVKNIVRILEETRSLLPQP